MATRLSIRPLPVPESSDVPVPVPADSWSMTFRKTDACCLQNGRNHDSSCCSTVLKMNKNGGPTLEGEGHNDFFRRQEKFQTGVL